MSDANTMTIGEVAAQTGLRTSAIRYYEGVGLLAAPVRSNGQRRYDDAVIKRIGFIQTAQKAGFSIEEMKTLLDSAASAQPFADRVQILARRKLEEVEAVIEHAQAMKRILQAGLSCHCEQMTDCPMFVGGEGMGDCLL